MDNAITITDDLTTQIQRYYKRFKISMAVAGFLLVVAICVACLYLSRSTSQVLANASVDLELKQETFERKLKAWCTNVENFAFHVSSASFVQLSAYYAFPLEERESVRTMAALENEDKAIMRYLSEMFAVYTESHSIFDAIIVMAGGDGLIGAYDHTKLTDSWKELLGNVIGEKSIQYGAFHTRNGKVLVDMGVPIFPAVEGENANPLGALIMSLPLNSLFLDILRPPADSRGIEKVAFVQLTKTEAGVQRHLPVRYPLYRPDAPDHSRA